MYQHLTDWETHAENMQISVCFCKTCICLKNLENLQTSVNMITDLLLLMNVMFYDFIYLAKGFRMDQRYDQP